MKLTKSQMPLVLCNHSNYMNAQLDCVCFGWKSLPKMLFRKWGCLVGPENSIFRKLKSVDRKKMPLTTEIILHFYFPFKVFPEYERERERETARTRAKGEETFQSVRRSSANSELQSAPISWAPVWQPRSEIAIDASRDRAVDHDLAKIEIAPSIAISPSRDRVGLDLSSDWICRRWWFFSGLWLMFF